MVQRGQIEEGMSKDAVWLAWGAPNQRISGQTAGKAFEMWKYTGLQAVYPTRVSMYSGMHYGGRGRHCVHPAFGYEMGPDYIPYTAAEVKFNGDKVASWAQQR